MEPLKQEIASPAWLIRPLLDALMLNLGLWLGLVIRYGVLVGLHIAPASFNGVPTPAGLWHDSMRAWVTTAPLLTVVGGLVLAAHGFYRLALPYYQRSFKALVQSSLIIFAVLGTLTYLSSLLKPLPLPWNLTPLPYSALLAGGAVTVGLLWLARQGAAIMRLNWFDQLTGPIVRNRYLLVGDLFLITLAASGSFLARLEGVGLLSGYQTTLGIYCLLALLCKPPIFYGLGLYQRYWRYASIGDAVKIVEATVLAMLGMIVLAYLIVPIFYAFPMVPRSIPFIDWLLTTTLVGGVRFALRFLGERVLLDRLRQEKLLKKPLGLRRVLIVGAGEAGAVIAREILHSSQLGWDAVGFVDDDPQKRRMRILGIPVLGTHQDIPQLVRNLHVHEVIVAMPTAPGTVIREVQQLCSLVNVPCRVWPGLYELLQGQVTVRQLRPVRIDDLLRRAPVQIDQTAVIKSLQGMRVLVTGAGGSIGSELCRQVVRCRPATLILLGHGENSIFQIYHELRRLVAELENETGGMAASAPPTIIPVIADIRDRERLQRVFSSLAPEIIFHAAAHKHVPLMEENPEEAITNNVGGTLNLLQLAEGYAAARFVMISTDKAVNPTSVMGATKRIAEQLVQQAAQRSGRCFVAVRFGNVLGSRGSVVPFFQEQIARGGPVTVTHPEVTRYFMTIPEAVQLVLQAETLGRGGEIFVLDMGDPIKIVDLARDMIRLAGFQDHEIPIVFTGLRPGEKLYEEIFIPGETHQRTPHEKIFVFTNGHTPDEKTLEAQVTTLIRIAQQGNQEKIFRLLKTLVPEYQPTGSLVEPLAWPVAVSQFAPRKP